MIKNMICERLSVIISIYNVCDYLDKCINSVINQTYKSLEIILVDDGSTDQSSKICDDYAAIDKRILVCHKANEGLVKSRKTGIELSTARYIAFIDGDDWIEPNMYEKMMQEIENSDVDVVDVGIFAQNPNGKEMVRTQSAQIIHLDINNRNTIMKKWLMGQQKCEVMHYLVTKVYKKEVIKRSYQNVPDGIDHAEDGLNFMWLLTIAKSISVMSEPYYHYVYRADSMSRHHTIHDIILRCNQLMRCRDILINKYQYIDNEVIDKWIMSQIMTSMFQINIAKYLCKYKFPEMDRIKDKKIVIYGAGSVGQDYVKQIASFENCKIVNWVDQNHEKYQYDYRKVNGMDTLDCEFDYIIIAVLEKEVADNIKQNLLQYGISEKKILWEKPRSIFDGIM